MRDTRPPVIGVVEQGNEKTQHYVRRIEAAGARAAVLDWRDGRDAAADATAFDGLVLCGGDDVDAAHFGEPNHPRVLLADPRRDVYEIAFCRAAVAARRPLLAVCRGAQVLNVALGGSLDQHVPDVAGRGEHGGGVQHALRVAPGTLLAGVAGSAPVVNSYHHQAVGRVAPDLVVSAWAEDGTPEAVEAAGPFCLGVQWHPEREGNDPPLGADLFARLAAVARNRG